MGAKGAEEETQSLPPSWMRHRRKKVMVQLLFDLINKERLE